MTVGVGVETDLALFLSALFPGETGYMELRALPSKEQTFVRIGDDAAVARHLTMHATENIYIGCASRRSTDGGTLAHCHELWVVFVDADFKQTSEPVVRDQLAAFPLPATLRVQSGGGLHVYWQLKDPFVL